jgi:hypothetical protein
LVLDLDLDPRLDRLEAPLDGPVDRRLGPPALPVQPLVEVAAPVQQGHRDHRHGEVGGRAERIAGEDAEAPGVRGHGEFEGDLHGEVGDPCRDHGLAATHLFQRRFSLDDNPASWSRERRP